MSLASDREQSRVIKEDEDDEVSKIDDVNSRYAACPTKSETGTVNIYSNHPTSKQGAGLPQRERERRRTSAPFGTRRWAPRSKTKRLDLVASPSSAVTHLRPSPFLRRSRRRNGSGGPVGSVPSANRSFRGPSKWTVSPEGSSIGRRPSPGVSPRATGDGHVRRFVAPNSSSAGKVYTSVLSPK